MIMNNKATNKLNCCIIIPARFNSSRLPGKPLIHLLKKPMILWVAELSAQAIGLNNVYVATDDQRILEVVQEAGFKTLMTDDALTGTDRVSQAAEKIEADIFINVQGDEPLLEPSDILKVRDAKLANMDKIINAFSWISESENPHDVNIPKVITSENNKLIYMSRIALPGYKDKTNAPGRYKKQASIYAYTKEELVSFNNYGRKSILEKSEDIEILRFFEFDKEILMIETSHNGHAVDVIEDVKKVESMLRERHVF